jgi:protein-L-isoaspartate(D-aspartate) O-methyltransferase
VGALSLDDRRRLFAEEVAAVSHVDAPALIDAFARVPREHFLAAGPWQIPRTPDATYRTTDDGDPRHLYHDVVVAIDTARALHNGQPSSLARWLASAEFRPGERVLHIGAGTGYYTAIIAEVVGARGQVVACEADPALAAQARAHLAGWPQVRVEAHDASAPHPMFAAPFDAIFVNAGCTFARPEWLAATRRIVLPVTIHLSQAKLGVGLMLRADREADSTRWAARLITQVSIYDCCNARDPAHEPILRRVLTPPPLQAIETAPHAEGPTCRAHIDGFCLQ